MSQKISDELAGVIGQMLKPLKGLSFKCVIEGLSGHTIIPFNKDDKKDRELLISLEKVAILAGNEVNKTGIIKTRANEAGNEIEIYVKKAMNEVGFEATTPITKSGKQKASGYPDIEFKDQFDRVTYLECKTFSEKSRDSAFRSFFVSPSDDFKTTADAHHLLIAFELYTENERSITVFKCKSWKIICLADLKCDVKFEFNSNNKSLYSSSLILAEGKI